MKKKITANILNFGDTNPFGLKFTKEVVEEALKDYQKRIDKGIAFVELGPKNEFDMAPKLINVAGKVSSIGIDSSMPIVLVDIEPIKTPQGEVLNDIIEYVDFVPCAHIDKDENGVIKSMEIVSIDAVPKYEN